MQSHVKERCALPLSIYWVKSTLNVVLQDESWMKQDNQSGNQPATFSQLTHKAMHNSMPTPQKALGASCNTADT